MSQFFNDHEIQNPGSLLLPWKKLKEKKNYEFLRKSFLLTWKDPSVVKIPKLNALDKSHSLLDLIV